MGEAHIRANAVGRVHVKPSSSGSHVKMTAGGAGHVQLVQEHWWGIHIYPYPNPGLAEALLDGRLGTIVHDYTQRVAQSYGQMLGARSSGKTDEKGEPAGLLSSIEANVWPYWGFKRDRWVGEVKVGNAKFPYGAADEFGRKNPDEKQRGSTTDGSHQLRSALYSVLPYPI